LFASYAANRPENWAVNQRTHDLICISVWMREELTAMQLDDVGRKVQEDQFNRMSRTLDDVFELAARIMNDTLEDKIDRNRRPHRRWG